MNTGSAISQVAKIRVDHEGTEAAAVSEIMTMDACAPIERERLDLVCDKPFFYYIKDGVNGDTAFIGVINAL